EVFGSAEHEPKRAARYRDGEAHHKWVRELRWYREIILFALKRGGLSLFPGRYRRGRTGWN
ncbi:MAG: hypothetical protein ACYCT0_08820, partial [Sulfobacillus sp.]